MRIYPESLEEHVYLHRKGVVAEPPPVKQGRFLVRLMLIAFTLLCMAGSVGFVLLLFEIRKRTPSTIAYALFAVLFYGLGERLIARRRFYRFGIEEALLLGGAGFLCGALAIPFDRIFRGQAGEIATALTVMAVFVVAYRRSGHFLAALTAFVALCTVPFLVFASDKTGRLVNFAVLLLLFLANARLLPRFKWNFERSRHRVFEAILFVAAYVFMNLRLDKLVSFRPRASAAAGFEPWFYWMTYASVVLLPLVAIAYALHVKRRPLLDVSLIGLLVTICTNKAYLNKPRYEWDSMILGLFLVGFAVAAQQWLAQEKNQKRSGLTAEKNRGLDMEGIELAAAGPWLAQMPAASPVAEGTSFSGGESGGAGASRSF